jgi:hypothetical protein
LIEQTLILKYSLCIAILDFKKECLPDNKQPKLVLNFLEETMQQDLLQDSIILEASWMMRLQVLQHPNLLAVFAPIQGNSPALALALSLLQIRTTILERWCDLSPESICRTAKQLAHHSV